MELIIFTGNIGCGKSLLASKFAKMKYVVVNNDAIVKMIGGGEYGAYDHNKKEIYHVAEQVIINASLSKGLSVVIDRTNMDKKHRDRFIEIGREYQAKIISYDWGPGTIADMQRRINNPYGVSSRQWQGVFNAMFESYEEPTIDEGFNEIVIPPKKYRFYAFDFDGTIVENKFPKIGEIISDEVAYMRELFCNLSNIIIIWTCRSGDYVNQMRTFLLKNKIPFDFVNENPIFNPGSKKIFAHVYRDDRNAVVYRNL